MDAGAVAGLEPDSVFGPRVVVNVPAYLARVAYSGPTEPTADNLRRIHHAHMLAVSFENLDISLGRRIVLDEDAIVNKIVVRRRGGFCYELNGAFAALLRALGFRVTLLSARVARAHGGAIRDSQTDHSSRRNAFVAGGCGSGTVRGGCEQPRQSDPPRIR